MKRIGLVISVIGSLWIQITAQHSLEKLPFPVNTDHDEICPVFNYQESILFFTREGSSDFNKTLIENHIDLSKVLVADKYYEHLSKVYSQIAGQKVTDPARSEFNQDIWVLEIARNRLWHPGIPLNNALPNSICSNYSKSNEYVIINQFPVEGGLKSGFSYTKMTEHGKFTIPIPITIKDFKKQGQGINLSMSHDGRQIFIAMSNSSNPDNQDIYVSTKLIDFMYSSPKKLDAHVNSPYRDATPFISQDKRRLYFSSNRPGGHGGMDIYYCERLDYTYHNWSEPKLLGPPINSPYDDSYPYVLMDENTVYFSSDRDGNSDIYKAKMYRDDLLDKPIAVNINILNEAGELIQGEIFWGEKYKDEMTGFFRTNTGQYRYIIEDNLPMVFTASRRSLKAEVISVDPQELKDQSIHEIDLDFVLQDKSPTKIPVTSAPEEATSLDNVLLGLESNKTVVLKNIYFVQSQPEVLEKSFPSLRHLARVLLRNPKLEIQVEGHTDNVGEKKDLMELSWERAQAIKAFLVDQGVDPARVSTRGFGDSKPLTNNSTEKERRQNRRVEIRVIKQ